MGDRANVVIQSGDNPPLFLYSHWGGNELPETLRQALDSAAGRGRWNDAPYLARIIFCRMIGRDVKGETGYGISTYLTDNEHSFLVVQPAIGPNPGVVYERAQATEGRSWLGPVIRSWSFPAYCAQEQARWKEDED